MNSDEIKRPPESNCGFISISKNSKLTLYEIVIRKEDEDYVIGRKHTAVYVVVPKIGVEVINLLKNNYTIEETINILSKKYDDSVIINDFIENLIKKGFVKKIDDNVLDERKKEFKGWFNWIKPKHVSWLFSKPMLILYFILFFSTLLLIILNPSYIPNYQDMFFHSWLAVVIAGSFCVGWVITFKHELFHLFAAKSLGVDASFSISNRLHYVVAQTDVTNIWSIERKKRYIVYLAGMLSDFLVISILIYYLWLSDKGVISYSSFLYRFLKMIILIEFFMILFQFQFFIRTDIYYVVANKFRCKNLMQDTKNYVKNQFYKLFPGKFRYIDQSDIPDHECKIIKIYAVMFIFGTIVILTIFFVFMLPMTIMIINNYIYNIITKLNTTDRYFYDGLATIVTTLIYFSLLIYSLYKKRKTKFVEKTGPKIIWVE